MADCGFPLPCESNISSATDALTITNSGDGGAISAIATGEFATALKAESNNGPGITTRSDDGSGITAVSDSSNGVRALSSSNHAVFATSRGSSGFSPPASGVFGESSTGNGVVGSSASGIGVRGVVNSGTGVSGTAMQNNGTGVIGSNASGGGAGVIGNGGYAGVIGNADGSFYSRGVIGNSNARGIGFVSLAGLFNGNVSITGGLSKGGGGFKIDHPLDSAKKYLNHSFVESSEMKNLYDGIAILDDNGETAVELPEWFDSLNCDFRYQLTSIGTSAPNLYIAEEISCNRFKIAGGKAGMRVSWQVTGIRHDPWAQANSLSVEEGKPENQQGHYLHPELYGQPEERGVEWAVNPELMRQMKEEQQNQTSTSMRSQIEE